MFSGLEQKAIEEKFEQLKKVKEGRLTPKELADLITQRRARWMEENLESVLPKYKLLAPEERAYNIIFFDHMKINPAHSRMIRVSPEKIRIESYNFCPYLEACRFLGLDTRQVCKEIGEPSMQRVCEMVHPGLRFSRNYENIRPQNSSFCEEYIELKK